MAATVVDGSVSSSTWTKKKPKDYKGTALDTALAAYEKAQGKNVTIPANLPTMPKQSAKEFEKCVKEMESAVKDLKSAATYLKDLAKTLDNVSSVGKSTAAELQKLGDGKTDKNERKAYFDAASTASAIALKASASSAQIQ